MKKQHSSALPDIFAQAMAALPPFAAAGEAAGQGVAIALSGGLDSSALLHLAHGWARERGVALHAFHIHHGLSPNADAWLAHCEQACAALGVAFAARRVQLRDVAKSGTEAAARKSRYAALGALCREHDVRLLLSAHHLDDQAETVLLQLLRGSGPAGLSGMDACNHAPELLGNAQLLLARPLLQTARSQLEAYVAGQGIAYVNDESNDDPRYARNALRHQVMPALATAFPGFQARLSRSAQHAQSAQRMLSELAEQDLQACLEADSIDLARLRALSADRAGNMLRQWFRVRKLGMPSTAWLAEMLAQLLEAREDAQLLVTHPDCHVRRHRDRLYLVPKLRELEGTREDRFDDKPGQHFRWNGESSLAFPAYGGVLHFDAAEEGLDAEWLQKQLLTIEFRRGGERLKPAPNRPTRDLKHHYQSLSIPAWERTRLPVVYIPGQLLFAAGIGMDCHKIGAGANKRIAFRWLAE
ncbi:tRNA lysidine(34) synthetase TilS [Massilia sp. NR 4-1]|uniref:tRNA lysidine(34) synthetase TilS n=1 Tax=Massilia sp. NR 4-1 TaxID=1678028 RepID=UPI00067A996F|nr:MesJ cell cycle protein [Massilia sp. NR 4-1]